MRMGGCRVQPAIRFGPYGYMLFHPRNEGQLDIHTYRKCAKVKVRTPVLLAFFYK